MTTHKQIIKTFKNRHILVVGDVILDQHIRGRVSRISPEAPVPIVLQEGEPQFAPGGAANVSNNLRNLGAKVTLVGRIGSDIEGRIFLDGLKKRKILTAGIFVDPSTPTIVKTRIIAQHQQVLRLDRELIPSTENEKFSRKIISFIKNNIRKFDAIIISDYGKGMITKTLIENVSGFAKEHNKVLTVDPKVEHFAYYRGVTAITPNKKETENAIRDIKVTHTERRKLALNSDRLHNFADIEKSGTQLQKFLDLECLLITLGDQGMCLFERGKKPVHIPTKAQDVYDVTGAGDTVIAVFTLGLVSGATKFQAADLANHAAGIVIGKLGPAPVTTSELLQVIT